MDAWKASLLPGREVTLMIVGPKGKEKRIMVHLVHENTHQSRTIYTNV